MLDEALKGMKVWQCRSHDNGRTWTACPDEILKVYQTFGEYNVLTIGFQLRGKPGVIFDARHHIFTEQDVADEYCEVLAEQCDWTKHEPEDDDVKV